MLFWCNMYSIITLYLYRPQRSCGQGNISTPVCHSVHRGGVPGPEGVVSHKALRQTPPDQADPLDQTHHPPGSDTPQSRHTTTPPPDQAHHPPPDQTHHPPDQTHHPPDQTPPPGPDTPPTRHTTPLRPDTHPLPPDQTHPREADYMVYEWPVRILLECILVQLKNSRAVISNLYPVSLENVIYCDITCTKMVGPFAIFLDEIFNEEQLSSYLSQPTSSTTSS